MKKFSQYIKESTTNTITDILNYELQRIKELDIFDGLVNFNEQQKDGCYYTTKAVKNLSKSITSSNGTTYIISDTKKSICTEPCYQYAIHLKRNRSFGSWANFNSSDLSELIEELGHLVDKLEGDGYKVYYILGNIRIDLLIIDK